MPKSKKKTPKYREYEGEDYHDEEPYDTEEEETKQKRLSKKDKTIYKKTTDDYFEQVKEKAKMTKKYDKTITCMIVDGMSNGVKITGYESVYASTGKNLSIAELVWRKTRGAMNKKHVMTHLCKHTNCCNPWHLHPESKGKNISRTGCKGYCRNPTSSDLLIVCEHDPKCINITEFVEHSDEELEEESTKIDVEKYQTIDPSEIDPSPKTKGKIWAKKNTR